MLATAFLAFGCVAWGVGVIPDGQAPKPAEADDAEKKPMVIDWEPSVAKALERARSENKPVMIEFYVDWQQWCRVLEQRSFTDDEIGKIARKLVCVRVDAEDEPGIAKKYDVKGYPTLVFLNSRGESIHRLVGFIPPGPLGLELEQIARGREPEKELRRLEESNPTEFRPLVMLGVGYQKRQEWETAIGYYEEALKAAGSLSEKETHEVVYTLSQLYDYKGSPEKSERLLSRLLREDSADKLKVNEMLGHIYLSLKQPEQAIEHFEAARALVEDENQRELLEQLIQRIREAQKRQK
jgi:tetratricopeptide (TPR) repeat protein